MEGSKKLAKEQLQRLLRAGGVLLGKTVFRQSFPAGFKAPGRLPVRVI